MKHNALFRLMLIGAALAVAVPAWSGCGPSLRRTEISDNAFLRCFDIDYHPARTVDEKQDCWSRWLERRVYNQPADKVEYAELRLAELGGGISVPGPPGPPGAFHERPVPTSADEKTTDEPGPMEEDDVNEVSVEPDAGKNDPAVTEDGVLAVDIDLSLPPGVHCEKGCRHSFEMCKIRCGDEAHADCRETCDTDYKSCMRSCFE